MQVALCQLDIAWENKSKNFARVRGLAGAANLKPGALLVLPEMFATSFSFDPSVAEEEGGITEKFLCELAKQYRVRAIGGVVTRVGNKKFNQSLVISPDGVVIGRYSKVYPFSGGGETNHHAGGTEIVIVDVDGFKVAPFICYDLRFPEPFRAAAMRGAEVFVCIANWPVKRIQHWITLLQARAIENQAYVVGVNRTGTDPNFTYNGRSIVVDPHGIIIADAGEAECVTLSEIDIATVRDWRRDFPALRDAQARVTSRS